MTKRRAIAGLKQALKTAKFIEAKNCGCSFCKAARRLRKQLAPAISYLAK